MCSDLPIKHKNNRFKRKIINWRLITILFTLYAFVNIPHVNVIFKIVTLIRNKSEF